MQEQALALARAEQVRRNEHEYVYCAEVCVYSPEVSVGCSEVCVRRPVPTGRSRG
jgi:hypothetical protein